MDAPGDDNARQQSSDEEESGNPEDASVTAEDIQDAFSTDEDNRVQVILDFAEDDDTAATMATLLEYTRSEDVTLDEGDVRDAARERGLLPDPDETSGDNQ